MILKGNLIKRAPVTLNNMLAKNVLDYPGMVKIIRIYE